MTEHAQSLEFVAVSAVLELDADEVPLVRSGTGTDFDSEGGSVIGQTVELGIMLGNLHHVEEGDNRLVGGLDEQELEGVSIEGNALQSSEDGVHGSATSDCAVELESRKPVKTADTYCYRFHPCRSRRRPCSHAS